MEVLNELCALAGDRGISQGEVALAALSLAYLAMLESLQDDGEEGDLRSVTFLELAKFLLRIRPFLVEELEFQQPEEVES